MKANLECRVQLASRYPHVLRMRDKCIVRAYMFRGGIEFSQRAGYGSRATGHCWVAMVPAR